MPVKGDRTIPPDHLDELLEILACPKCKQPVAYRKEDNVFLCKNCRLKFPVIDGIPDFLLEDAEPLED